MKGKIEKTALLQYIFIYLSMQYFGGRIPAALGNNVFFTLVLILVAGTYLVHMGWLFRDGGKVNKFIFFEIIMACFLAIEYIYMDGGMTWGTILSFLLRFMVVHISINSDPKNYLTRLIKMILVFAVISDMIYFSQLMGFSSIWNALSHFAYRIHSDNWASSDTYGLFLIVFKLDDLQRNSYMFGEPGEYQMIINTALFFLLYFENKIDIKKKSRAILVLLITLLTIQSTSGFISAIVILVGALIQRKDNIERQTRRVLLGFIFVAIVYCLFFATQDSILYRTFINKIFSDTGKVDLFQGTATDRSMPFISLTRILQNNPMQALFGVGPEGLSRTLIGGYTANGLINSIMMFGLIFTVIIYGYMIAANIKYTRNIATSLVAIFVVVNQALGQPDMLAIFSVVLLLWPYITELSLNEMKCY